jgi:hypothetical protein
MVRKTIASAVRRRRGDLRAGLDDTVLVERGGQPTRHVDARGRRWEELHAHQLEERDVAPLWHAIEPVQHLVHDVGERLDQRDPGIGDVVIGPLRAAPLDESFAVVDEVLEPPVVEVGRSERHGHSSDGIT